MGLKKGETALVVCDKPLRKIGRILFEKAAELEFDAIFLEMIPLKMHGEEPPSLVAEAMKSSDVVVVPTSTSLSLTAARRQACDAGARIATLPTITEDIMKRAIPADYSKIKERSIRVANVLSQTNAARVTTESGTDITLSLEGRKALADFGIYHKKGDFGNLPAGEACIAPVEGTSSGVIVVDGAIAGIGKMDSPCMITVEKGIVKNIENCPELEKILDKYGESARCIAELGVGTNDKAKVIGNVLEDEKVMGTVHIALGNNIAFGGVIDVPVHLDCIILDPTLEVEGGDIIDKGRYVYDLD